VKLSTLESCALVGVSPLDGPQFDSIAQECHRAALETGDARFAILAAAIANFVRWWDDYGGAPAQVVTPIDELVKTQVPLILRESDPAAATRLAQAFKLDLADLLIGPGDWKRQGFVRPLPR
jgi:hypothetical protein